jgi:tetratricopeptide (TPR) repeat protein
MKRRLLKLLGIALGAVAALVVVAFVVYVILYYPRKAEPFEINTPGPAKTLLIATQGSGFKDALAGALCDSLKSSSIYIKGIDVGGLDEVDDGDWDKILIVNSFVIRLNKGVERFVNRAASPDNILLLVTSGGADWKPKPELRVDALTSASRKEYVSGLVRLIAGWIGTEDGQEWAPDDYLLALTYFPMVDVDVACEAIALESERYVAMYPNLVELINRAGYQYVRLKEVDSAVKVFRLNVSLFPDYWNVYDSYGEALLAKGDRKAAIQSYTKALELNPEAKSSKDMLDKLSKS